MLTTFGRVTYQVSSGLAAMLGAGVLAGLAPAASAAGAVLLAGLVIAAALAVVCGLSIADESPRPVPFVLAVLGRIAGASAIASTFGAYLLPAHPGPAGIGLIAVGTAVCAVGRGTHTLTVAGVAVVLAVLAVFVAACFAIEPAGPAVAPPPTGAAGTGDLAGLPVATALMFFCFLGFDRVERRWRVLTIGVALVITTAVAAAALYQLGGPRLALSPAPLRDALAAADASGLDGPVTAGVAVATLLALVGVLAGVRDGPRGALLTPLTATAAAAVSVLLPATTAIASAVALMLGHYALSAVDVLRRRARAPGSAPQR